MGPEEPWLCVLAPTSILMVEIEQAQGGTRETEAEVHVHPGGQGLWVASMARALGARVTVCGPFGGEGGAILQQLVAKDGAEVRAIAYAGGNGAIVHDRRSGERVELAIMPARPLQRHETDELLERPSSPAPTPMSASSPGPNQPRSSRRASSRG